MTRDPIFITRQVNKKVIELNTMYRNIAKRNNEEPQEFITETGVRSLISGVTDDTFKEAKNKMKSLILGYWKTKQTSPSSCS